MRCGAVWCGAVWCGVVWCGAVWCGAVWCGEVWLPAFIRECIRTFTLALAAPCVRPVALSSKPKPCCGCANHSPQVSLVSLVPRFFLTPFPRAAHARARSSVSRSLWTHTRLCCEMHCHREPSHTANHLSLTHTTHHTPHAHTSLRAICGVVAAACARAYSL